MRKISNTPYAKTHASKVCMYCGEVFTTRSIYNDGKYYTVGCVKQLQEHYVSNHQKVTK